MRGERGAEEQVCMGRTENGSFPEKTGDENVQPTGTHTDPLQ